MIDRRTMLAAGAASVPAAALATGSAKAADMATQSPQVAGSGWVLEALQSEPLFNRDNAWRTLDALGLDALLVSTPPALYQVAAARFVTDLMTPHSPPQFALLVRDEKQPVRLLMPSFTFYYLWVDAPPGSWLEPRIYTAPFGGDGGPARPTMMRVVDEAALGPRERKARAETAKLEATMQASSDLGVRSMLADAGVARGRIGVDSPEAAATLERIGFAGTTTGAADALALMRRVKSALEIRLMRHASEHNTEAADAAAKLLRDGATTGEFRRAYFAEIARRGGQGEFMVIDQSVVELDDRALAEGEAFLLDAVSSFYGYHGDFGRTVFLGEPDRQMQRVTALMRECWLSIRELMVPGATYGELIEAGRKALAKTSLDVNLVFNVHSVGLWHTDDPARDGAHGGLTTKLEPGMTLSVDVPLFDVGHGGTAHFEDLTLITEDGPEALHAEYPPGLLV